MGRESLFKDGDFLREAMLMVYDSNFKLRINATQTFYCLFFQILTMSLIKLKFILMTTFYQIHMTFFFTFNLLF